MRQQVNLFTPQLLGSVDPLAATRLLAGVGGVLVVVLLWGVWQQWQLGEQRQQNALLQAELDQRQAALTQRRAALEARQATTVLEQRLARLQQEQRAKQSLLGTVSGQDFGNLDGFSGQITALGRHPPEGLWLRTIALANGGNELLLEGSTLDAACLPQYLQALAAEPWFAGTLFNRLALQRSTADPNQLNFVLVTPCHDAQGQPLSADACRERIRQAVR
jgi:Tfp pilus assembly protein PilN